MNRYVNFCFAAILMLGTLSARTLTAQSSQNSERLKADTIANVKSKLVPLLEKYCQSACELINVQATTEEIVDEDNIELGFESLEQNASRRSFMIKDLTIDIQIDDKVSSMNRERLQNIFLNHLRSFGINPVISWKAIKLPVFGQSSNIVDQVKARLERKIQSVVAEVVQSYCPNQCIHSQTLINASDVSADEAMALPRNQIFRGEKVEDVIRVDDVVIMMDLDEKLQETARTKILNVIQSKMRFVTPVRVESSVIAFPESADITKQKLEAEQKDPFQLEKLRQMLTMFKELAGTKEIITTTKESSNNNNNTESTTESSQTNNEKSTKSDVSLTQHNTDASNTSVEWAAYIGAFILIAGLIVAVFLRVLAANREVRVSSSKGSSSKDRGLQSSIAPNFQVMPGFVNPQQQMMGASHEAAPERNFGGSTSPAISNIKIEKIKNELIYKLNANPKVAHACFTKMLRDEGIEVVAKYLKILGDVVVTELLDDPSMRDKMSELSDFYHKAQFQMSHNEEFGLLESLQSKLTAVEIKMLSSRDIDEFDFLKKLSVMQIFELIRFETPKIQSAVLAQLGADIRSQVFGSFAGSYKNQLIAEMSKDEMYHREYLKSLALSLQQKVVENPNIQAERFDQSALIVEVMERSSIAEQRSIMLSVQGSNPSLAKSIKDKLASLETLLYVRDGILLEMVMGFNREDLLALFSKMPQHIRGHILTKAPRELASSWYEDLQSFGVVDEKTFRNVESLVLSRIKNFAQAGQINLAQINDQILGTTAQQTTTPTGTAQNRIPPPPINRGMNGQDTKLSTLPPKPVAA